jgi:hypothetical protein
MEENLPRMPQDIATTGRPPMRFTGKLIIALCGMCGVALFIVLITIDVFWVPLRGASIAFRGTPEYQQASREFACTVEEAVQAILRHNKQLTPAGASPSTFVGKHHMIVDGHYVFSGPCKEGIPLWGYYVDGTNCTVEFRTDVQPEYIPIEQARWMGFTYEQ